MSIRCLQRFAGARRRGVFILALVSFLLSGVELASAGGPTFLPASASASAGSHGRPSSITGLPPSALQSASSTVFSSTVSPAPFGLSVSEVAGTQSSADPTALLGGSVGSQIQFSMSSGSLGSSQTFTLSAGSGVGELTPSYWMGDTLRMQTTTYPELLSTNRIPGAYGGGVGNNLGSGNHFEAAGEVARWVFAKQSRYPITVTLPVNLELADDLYWFGHQNGWISSGVSVRIPLSFIPTRYGKWSAASSADICYYGSTKTEFVNSVQPQVPKVAAAITLAY
jgi:hypothetical protein